MHYYAVERSMDHLAHYGIKGMSWGVRKAIQLGSDKKLSKQYKKAKKKLERLSAKADLSKQTEAVKKHSHRAAVAAGIGLNGLGAAAFNNLVAKKIAEAAATVSSSTGPITNLARKKRIVGDGKGIYKVGEGLGIGPVGDSGTEPILLNGGRASTGASGGSSRTKSRPNEFRTRDRTAKGVAVAGLGTAAYQTGKAIAAKYRTTAKGHAKAIAKRDAFKREMQKAFKGTKYGTSKHRRKSK
jgi:hypothetical protein